MPQETNFLPNLGEIFESAASQVNLFRDINSPGYVIGDIAITAAGVTYEWDGDSWNSISFGGGGGAAQTPWAQDIQGAGFDLLNVRDITATRNITAEGRLGAFDTTRIGDTDNEWYWKAEDAGMSLYGTGSGGTFKYMSISDPNEGMVLHGTYSFHAAGFDGKQLSLLPDANVTPLTIGGYSLTAANAQSMIDLAGTWNTSGNPVALKLAISNTASGATSKFLSFLAGAAGATEVFSVLKDGAILTGVTSAANIISGGIGLGFGPTVGASTMYIAGTNATLWSGGGLRWSETSDPSAAADLILARDAANTLALRNSTNAQRLRIYNSFTTVDTSGEWLKIDWQVTANQCRIGTVMGTSAGTARVLSIDYGALSASPTAAITIPIASGAIVFGGGGTFAGAVQVGVSSSLNWAGRSVLGSPSDGVVYLANNAGNDFFRLQFGGTTSGFGGIARDGAGLRIVTADSNTAYSFLGVSELRDSGGLKVISARRTGWSAATGGATRTTFDTTTVTLPVLAEHVKALVDDFIAHGAIGA